MTDDLKCEWKQDDEGDWHTSCGHVFVLLDGTPRGRRMKFCCYCGAIMEEFVGESHS